MSITTAMRAGFIEALLEEFEAECESAIELPMDEADTVYMSDCTLHLARDGANGYTLKLEAHGIRSEIKLRASIGSDGGPRLKAFIG